MLHVLWCYVAIVQTLHEWLACTEIDFDVDLFISCAGKYDSHAALPHVTELKSNAYKVNFQLLADNRLDGAFMP